MHINHNGGVCVSDFNARIFVAFESEERVRFRYNGKQAKKKKKTLFILDLSLQTLAIKLLYPISTMTVFISLLKLDIS